MSEIERSSWADSETGGGTAATWQEPGAVGGTAATDRGNVRPAAVGRGTVRAEPEQSRRLRENFGFFGPAAFAYAVFYAFCMYRNGSGVTFPFFVAGSLLLLCLSLSKLGLTLKRGSVFYMAAIMLLGISTFCTDDSRIIFFNKLGIFLLTMSLLLKQYFDTAKWGLGKYLGSICLLAFAGIGEIGRPFSDAKAYRIAKAGRTDRRFWAVGLGLLAGVPLFFVVFLLLSGADALFRQMTAGVLDHISLGGILNIVFRIVFLFLAFYGLTSCLCKRKLREEVKERGTGEPLAAVTVTGMLTMLYLFFSGIQIFGLFLGKMKLPGNYTYAQYAREGFFQLLAVSFLNLVIVLVCLRFFGRSRLLKTILTVMSLCTFVMIASSAMRMIIYIRYYNLTFLRVLVLWALCLLALLFAGVLVNIFRESFPLFGYSVAVVTVLYLALSFAHPDLIIAKVNVACASGGGAAGEEGRTGPARPCHDYAYLSRLSADAAPVLAPYLKELGYCMEAFQADSPRAYAEQANEGRNGRDSFGYYWMEKMRRRTERFSPRTFNVSRWVMLRLMKK